VDGVSKGEGLVDLNGLASGTDGVQDVEEGVTSWGQEDRRSVEG